MLRDEPSSIADVLERRRRQALMRYVSNVILTCITIPLIGWQFAVPPALAYGCLQWLESRLYRRQLSPAEERYACGLFSLSMIFYCLPGLFLAMRLGSWGHVYAVYIIGAAVVNTVPITIGNRISFTALVAPCLGSFVMLPLIRLLQPHPPGAAVLGALLFGGFYFVFCAVQIWRTGTLSKVAELDAIRRQTAQRDAHEARLLLLTRQDTLTGLLNRDALRASLEDLATNVQEAALLLIDLDGFKYVNDTLGHAAGDEVLRAVAGRIENAAGQESIAARLGGDEFALLLTGPRQAELAPETAAALITRITQPMALDGRSVNIGASIGIALYPQHGACAEDLFSSADLALYQAKGEGRHRACVYSPGLREGARAKLLRDTELRQALTHGEFEMFYQPQIRLSDNALTGAEALLRWRHPEQGLLTPDKFLPALESGQLAAETGAWVIETACAQAAIWRQQFSPGFRMGVNLFGAQFRAGNLVDWVEAALTKTGLPPEALEIEITENVILRHEDDVIAPLAELRRRGVLIAFDDYGTGFASLSMLTRYPVSRLKIDRAFTSGMSSSPAEATIVSAIIRMAQALGLAVTAEGVETAFQADFLRRKGCGEGQGYLFGAPMPAAAFEAQFTPQPVLPVLH